MLYIGHALTRVSTVVSFCQGTLTWFLYYSQSIYCDNIIIFLVLLGP